MWINFLKNHLWLLNSINQGLALLVMKFQLLNSCQIIYFSGVSLFKLFCMLLVRNAMVGANMCVRTNLFF